jgi:hypothetical protein
MRSICEKDGVYELFHERSVVDVLKRLGVNSALVTVRRLVGGMPRAMTSYRPTTQTQTYTYASGDTVLTCQPEVIERFAAVWP